MKKLLTLPSFPQYRIDLLHQVMDIHLYEEEMLFALLLLGRPELSIVYMSSVPISQPLVDYYLRLLPDPEDAWRRLTLISLNDARPLPLVTKLSLRPDVMRLLDQELASHAAYLFPFEVTADEWAVAKALQIPVFGPPPKLVRIGTKSGSRRAAHAAGVPVLDGAGDLRSMLDVARELDHLHERRPNLRAAVVKLNRGFGGQGNAVIDLYAVPSPLKDADATSRDASWWESFGQQVLDEGAIIEEYVDEPGAAFPSVQLRIGLKGIVDIISSHDQLLAGAEKQEYVGARFPAGDRYRCRIEGEALKVGHLVGSKGMVGMFGIDFIAIPYQSGYKLYLDEINLRVTATLRHFLTATAVTEGQYNSAAGRITTRSGPRVYVAADNLCSDKFRGQPEQLLAALRDQDLAYAKQSRTGVVLHLLGALTEFGRFGATCIGDSPERAESMYRGVLELADARTGR